MEKFPGHIPSTEAKMKRSGRSLAAAAAFAGALGATEAATAQTNDYEDVVPSATQEAAGGFVEQLNRINADNPVVRMLEERGFTTAPAPEAGLSTTPAETIEQLQDQLELLESEAVLTLVERGDTDTAFAVQEQFAALAAAISRERAAMGMVAEAAQDLENFWLSRAGTIFNQLSRTPAGKDITLDQVQADPQGHFELLSQIKGYGPEMKQRLINVAAYEEALAKRQTEYQTIVKDRSEMGAGLITYLAAQNIDAANYGFTLDVSRPIAGAE